MPNISGSGGRSTGVNYATSALFDRMLSSLQNAPYKKRGIEVLAVTYQAATGASGGAGSLKRIVKHL